MQTPFAEHLQLFSRIYIASDLRVIAYQINATFRAAPTKDNYIYSKFSRIR